MENPFIFGKVVRGAYFCDRKTEIERIMNIVKSKQHIVIISPRRFGKTSLIINTLDRMKTPYIYVDFSLLDDEKSIIAAIVNDYAGKLDNLALLEKFLKKFEFSFSITVQPVSVTINEVKVNSLKNLLTEISKNYVLVFDEFQDVYEKDKSLVNKFRSIVQFIENSVVVLGSKRHVLANMFLKPRGIFYNFGYALHLEKINRLDFKNFIIKWFEKSSLKLSEKEVEDAIDLTEGHPFYTQYFCHFLFESKSKANEFSSVDRVLRNIVEMNSVFYDETFRVLPKSQRNALSLLAHADEQIYSQEVLHKFKISSTQTLQKALSALVKKELIDKNGKYYIIDVFFKHWLRQKELYQKV